MKCSRRLKGWRLITAVAAVVSVASWSAAGASARAGSSCKEAVAAAHGELLVCARGGALACTFPKYEALRSSRKRCLRSKEGKALSAYHAQVGKMLVGRKAEAALRGKLKSAEQAVMLAKVEELPDVLEIAMFAKAELRSHEGTYGPVRAETKALAVKLDAALATRQKDLDALRRKLAIAARSIVKTGMYTSDDGLRPAKVAEVWARAANSRIVRVAGQMNSSLQRFVFAPTSDVGAQVPLKGDRSAAPAFELREVGSTGPQMRVVVAFSAIVPIGTPLLVWEADPSKEYFVAVTPDAARFRVPYATAEGRRMYRTVEPLGDDGEKPRFKPFRQAHLPGAALAGLARVGVLDAGKVQAFAAASAKARECYAKLQVKLGAKVAKLRKANKGAAADELMGGIPDKALAKCKRLIKPVAKLYKGLAKAYQVRRAIAFETVRSLVTIYK